MAICDSGINHGSIKSSHQPVLANWQWIGTFLHIAHEEGLISNFSIHAGIRAPVSRPKGDLRNDVRCGFDMVRARDIDRIGIPGIIQTLKKRVGDRKVYISVDIDVLDPAFAPGECPIFFGIQHLRKMPTGCDITSLRPPSWCVGSLLVLARAVAEHQCAFVSSNRFHNAHRLLSGIIAHPHQLQEMVPCVPSKTIKPL